MLALWEYFWTTPWPPPAVSSSSWLSVGLQGAMRHGNSILIASYIVYKMWTHHGQ